ncbi:hypothetical protein BC939DRAFT_499596 [Gamsiella multidivaricata]|uniref:uncharacterized protein n=1 Tax=Gamsiella multidivaricata TaxID=101098 RepID=UPI00221F8D77|nr:uncharacterized protein BC939DRAFT_499596 [Gamsiella multidivaricata]KAI7830472.1 hypothetical protein BC939DRAFT_499596 [Gamsiella multidivaricata]
MLDFAAVDAAPSQVMAESDIDIPTIDAVFLVRFDTRRGNILEWSDSTPGIQLNGIEFSALPSGLHNSSQDVIYFQLEGCIGVSVYANVPSSNVEHRGAQMASVGILVKPSADTGRCGQVWRHVQFLKGQARHHATNDSDTTELAAYFARHKTPLHAAGPSTSSSKRDAYRARNIRRISRSFTLSEPIPAITQSQNGRHEVTQTDDIPASHPSHHFLRLVQALGPSIYILWKAALLRKRILIYTPPPIESACLFVYNVCLMATVPFGTSVISQSKSNEKIQPLFCVGIHDIDHMEALRGGYVACTTDKLFLFKSQLYDVLVDLSAPTTKAIYATPSSAHPLIQIVKSTGKGLEQTECHPNAADNRRYFILLQELGRFRRRQEWMQRRLYAEAASSGSYTDPGETEDASELHEPELPTIDSTAGMPVSGFNMSDTLRKMLTGGWWWWYGGEDSEEDGLESLLPRATVPEQEHESQDENGPLSGARLQVIHTQASGSSDTEAIRFFHNLTSILFMDLGQLIAFKETAAIFEEAESVSIIAEEDASRRPVEISRQDMRQLGLDPFKDCDFVHELGRLYFGSEVQLDDSGFSVWCCNLSSCCLPPS